MKLILTLLACVVGLATAAPALAGNGQSVTESLGSVQVSSTDASPAVSVAAPVGASVPVCVASSCSSSQAVGDAASSSTSTGESGKSRAAHQSVSESVATVQAGSTKVDPVVSAATPVGAAAPVCVASRCSGARWVGQAGSSSGTSAGDGTSHAVHQRVSDSVGSVQVGSTSLSPAVSVAAPVGAFVPVCVAGHCSATQSLGRSGSTETTPPTPPAGTSETTAPPVSASSSTSEPAASGTLRGNPAGTTSWGSRSRAKKAPKSGVFAPVTGPRRRQTSPPAGSRHSNGHRAGHGKGCDFSGTSAKLDSTPTASSLVPPGGFSLTILLAILCGLLGFSSLAQWIRSELRWRTD
jgi:hypothetical protein